MPKWIAGAKLRQARRLQRAACCDCAKAEHRRQPNRAGVLFSVGSGVLKHPDRDYVHVRVHSRRCCGKAGCRANRDICPGCERHRGPAHPCRNLQPDRPRTPPAASPPACPPSPGPGLCRVWSGVCSVQRPVHPPGGGSVQVDDVWKLHALLMRDMAARDCSPAGSQHAHLRGRRAERGAAAHGLGGRHRQSSSPNAETSRWIDSKRNRPGVMRGPTKASSVQLYSNGAALFSSPCRCSALVACSPTVRPLKSDPPDFSKSYTWFFGVPNPTP